jgi:hypothetical protein
MANIELPSDYESCGQCGFDHDYEYEAAYNWHLADAEGTEQPMAKKSKEDKIIDKAIDVAYRNGCANIQINMMDIPNVFAEGKKFYLEGKRDDELRDAIRQYVESIRQN